MSFNWDDYFALAEELAGIPARAVSEEARLRTALSRAYYACYHQALAIAQQHDNYRVPSTGSVHLALVQHFRQHPAPRRQAIARALDRLRVMRGKADYADYYPAATVANRPNVHIALADAARLKRELGRL